MIAVDNTFLTLMLHPSAKPPLDPSTKSPLDHVDERIALLIETWDKDRETIIIPTPVLSEFLILAGNDGPKYLAEIDKKNSFHIEGFDTRAAIELATVESAMRSTRGKNADKREGVQGTWAKIKFDRQIVAIAKVNGVTRIYSDDEGVEKFAKRCGIDVVRTWELPVPPEKEPLLKYAETLTAGLKTKRMMWPGDDHGQTQANGTEETGGTAVAGVPEFSESGAPASVSSQEGSGTGEGETGKG
ncbi:MAG TPA: hypothetical protein VGW12_10815 [Pyrinomonadaceae bacterium]|nr:hypothetical protein [Pyrinomonadaceae bacterium]